MVLLALNKIVSILALCLGLSTFLVLRRYGFTDKVCIGAGILCILAVAIFWSCVMLGAEDEDE